MHMSETHERRGGVVHGGGIPSKKLHSRARKTGEPPVRILQKEKERLYLKRNVQRTVAEKILFRDRRDFVIILGKGPSLKGKKARAKNYLLMGGEIRGR